MMRLPKKEKILIVSPMVPRPDMNSGDLRLYSLIVILAKEKEVSFVSMSCRPGDDAYVSLLEQCGVIVYLESFSLWKLLKRENFKVAILEFYFTAEYYIGRIRILQPDCRLIVDSVDVHYLRLQLKYELTKDEADQAIYRETKERELAVYSKADAVITVTRDDASALRAECPDILCEVVPNTHHLRLSDAPPERDTLIFVGGFSHDPNVDAVRHFCTDILPLIRESKPNIRLTIVGNNPPENIRLLENEHVTVTGYVPETSPYLHRSHVSVAPLRYGAGMKGKIGEAMAHGIPVVTTVVGAQGMGLAHGKNVMIADTPRCFAAAVLELLEDKRLWETIRGNAIQLIEDNYTPKQVGQAIMGALERIHTKPIKRMKFCDKVVFANDYITTWVKSRLSSC